MPLGILDFLSYPMTNKLSNKYSRPKALKQGTNHSPNLENNRARDELASSSVAHEHLI
jgi:hypothetical protein